jgi:predicted dithiol-disulfide oxidoreductase (DUF899 family)
MELPQIVTQDEWLTARKALLVKEKEHMRAGDRLSAERRALPWVKVEKIYFFDGPEGKVSLADLFDGCSQLIVHHLMFHPDWEAGCPGCSFQADHIDGPRQHLEHHDVRIVAVSRAPLAKLAAYKRRMGWGFDWVSSYGSDFNYDFRVSFTKDQIAAGRVEYNFGTITDDARYHSEELPGVSVFYKDQDGQVFHTYSTYARGLDAILGGDHYLDLTPKGRCEADYPNWPRRHDEYERAAPRSGESYAERRA